MTGYGQAEKKTTSGTYRIEIRSVNNRYFELQVRIPRKLSVVEARIKKLINDEITRGSVTAYINLIGDDDVDTIHWEPRQADSYVAVLKEVKKRYGLKDPITLSHLLGFNDLLGKQSDEQSEEILWKHIKPVLTKALDEFSKSRQKEAAFIVTDLKKMVKQIALTLEKIEKQAPQRIVQYQEILRKRIRELVGNNFDESRLAVEIALMADKLDIAEECTRLRAHLEKMNEDLVSSEPAGKKLGFLLQEMNREANTIGSKSNDIKISHWSVDLKENIEKIREQISNIE